MKLRIPIERNNAWALLWAGISALIAGRASLHFEVDEINGKKRAVLLSRDELAELQQGHVEAAANAALLREVMEEIVANCPPELINDPVVAQLRESLSALDKRTLH